MRLSKKSEYACLALIDLSQHYDEGFIRTADISKRKDIPRNYLGQILFLLKGSGYVRSGRGTGGGYRLARPPAKISVAEVVRLMDGAIAPVESASRYFYEHTPIERAPKLLRVLKEIRDHIAKKLETTTFADVK